MKSRKLESAFFTDPYIQNLSLKHKWIYVYYLFNKSVNWLGCYEITDKTALFEMDGNITSQDLQDAKKRFQQDDKIMFVKSYVIIKNSEKYETFLTNKQLCKTALQQFRKLPDDIKSAFLKFKPIDVVNAYKEMFLNLNYEIDSNLLVGYTVGYSVAYGVSEVISNKNKEIQNTEEKKIKIKEKKNLNWILETWNQVFDTKYKTTAAFENNATYWMTVYTQDEIKKAINLSKRNEFWGDKINPTIFFRRRNPQGEGVDYIGTFLNERGENKNLYVADNDLLRISREFYDMGTSKR